MYMSYIMVSNCHYILVLFQKCVFYVLHAYDTHFLEVWHLEIHKLWSIRKQFPQSFQKKNAHLFRNLLRATFTASLSALSSREDSASSGRHWFIGRYSPHAAKNVPPTVLAFAPSSPKLSVPPGKPFNFLNIRLQFWQGGFGVLYPAGLNQNAEEFQWTLSSVSRGWQYTTAFFRLCLKSQILLYKQRGLKKWLTATDDPTNHLPLWDTCVNTLGLNMLLFESLLNKPFATVITAWAWLSLPFGPWEHSAMSLNWNNKKNKRGPLLFYQWVRVVLVEIMN